MLGRVCVCGGCQGCGVAGRNFLQHLPQTSWSPPSLLPHLLSAYILSCSFQTNWVHWHNFFNFLPPHYKLPLCTAPDPDLTANLRAISSLSPDCFLHLAPHLIHLDLFQDWAQTAECKEMLVIPLSFFVYTLGQIVIAEPLGLPSAAEYSVLILLCWPLLLHFPLIWWGKHPNQSSAYSLYTEISHSLRDRSYSFSLNCNYAYGSHVHSSSPEFIPGLQNHLSCLLDIPIHILYNYFKFSLP